MVLPLSFISVNIGDENFREFTIRIWNRNIEPFLRWYYDKGRSFEELNPSFFFFLISKSIWEKDFLEWLNINIGETMLVLFVLFFMDKQTRKFGKFYRIAIPILGIYTFFMQSKVLSFYACSVRHAIDSYSYYHWTKKKNVSFLRDIVISNHEFLIYCYEM